MSYSPYPDGMSEDDLPGAHDRGCPECEETGEVGCEECDATGFVRYDDDEEDSKCDTCYGTAINTCPYCEGTGMIDSREYDRRKRDEYYADMDPDDYYEMRYGKDYD